MAGSQETFGKKEREKKRLKKKQDKLIKKETGLPVTIAEDALSCVAIGTGKALEQEGIFSSMLTSY